MNSRVNLFIIVLLFLLLFFPATKGLAQQFFTGFQMNDQYNGNIVYPILTSNFVASSILLQESNVGVKTFLDNQHVDQINEFSKTDLLKKEIQKLNEELDELNAKIDCLVKENQQLKLDLQKYNEEEKLALQKNAQIEALKDEARTLKALLGDYNVPESYVSAQNLIIIGDIELAKNQHLSFLEKASNNKKSKDYLSNSDKSGNFIAYSNYWLGKIENINGDYRKAVEYYSECYKITSYSTLSLMALLGLVESLTFLGNETEACTAIKQFQEDYVKASSAKTFHFNPTYLNMLERYKLINRCQPSKN